ncbi:MAG: hypothetical protein IJL59_07930 [Clostridia bacterium]|nr:hypothetical protein [Clostridia bacterium]
MRFLIVTYDEYRNIPFVRKYEKCISECGGEYDIVLWNRSGENVEHPTNHLIFHATDKKDKLSKIIPFLRWRAFVRKQLKEGHYDRVIVITTIPAILIADVLIRKYPNRYWLDIRDFTYEQLPLYKRLVHRLVCASANTSISSPGFYSFVPKLEKVCLTHNITNVSERTQACTYHAEQPKTVIGFVGGIQYLEENQRLCDRFKNHPRYELRYVGKVHPGCDLQTYCKENGMENVSFFPPYRNEEKPRIYKDIDIINSVYGSKTEITKIALPNRLYDAALYHKPILVSSGTLLAELVSQFHLGLPVDADDDNLVAKVDAYLASFDREQFDAGCETFLSDVLKDEAEYCHRVSLFCALGADKPLSIQSAGN